MITRLVAAVALAGSLLFAPALVEQAYAGHGGGGHGVEDTVEAATLVVVATSVEGERRNACSYRAFKLLASTWFSLGWRYQPQAERDRLASIAAGFSCSQSPQSRDFIARCRNWLGAWSSSNSAPTMGVHDPNRYRLKQKNAVLMD